MEWIIDYSKKCLIYLWFPYWPECSRVADEQILLILTWLALSFRFYTNLYWNKTVKIVFWIILLQIIKHIATKLIWFKSLYYLPTLKIHTFCWYFHRSLKIQHLSPPQDYLCPHPNYLIIFPHVLSFKA